MGIPVPKMTMQETVDAISREITQHKAELFHVITLNPEMTMACQHDPDLRRIVNEAGLLTADGIGIIMVSRLKGNPLPERVTGCDLLVELLEKANAASWSFYLLGAEESTSRQAAKAIQETYPGVTLLGRHHGYFAPSEEERILTEIHSLKPDVLIVALGAPRAEKWIDQHKNRLNAKIAIGVGGSLDIIAGKVKRAPVMWQRLNAEWLFRLINQPSRWRRQLLLPRFAVQALRYKEK